MAKEDKSKNKASLEDVISTIEKVCGKGTMQIGVQVVDLKRLALPARSVNRALYGGLPFGRIIEFYGAEHSGKTTTALLAIGAYQKTAKAKKVVFIDVEGSYDPIWAAKLGVDNSKLILFTPDIQTAEEILEYILTLISTGEVGFLVLDSIPALVPQNESEREMGQVTMGGISAPLTVFTRKLQRVLNKNNDAIFIGINQLRDNMSQYGAPTRTTGGRAWKHGGSLRVEFKGYNIDENFKPLSASAEGVAGSMVQACVVKNKTAPRDIKLGQYFILFHSGFSEVRDIFNYALNEELISQGGSSYTFIDKETGEVYKKVGQQRFISELSPDMFTALKKAVDEHIMEFSKIDYDGQLEEVTTDEDSYEDGIDGKN